MLKVCVLEADFLFPLQAGALSGGSSGGAGAFMGGWRLGAYWLCFSALMAIPAIPFPLFGTLMCSICRWINLVHSDKARWDPSPQDAAAVSL